jgi:hypothetical protein
MEVKCSSEMLLPTYWIIRHVIQKSIILIFRDIDGYQLFKSHTASILYPKDKSEMFFRNVATHILDYSARNPKVHNINLQRHENLKRKTSQ